MRRTAPSVSVANFSDTCSFNPKSNESRHSPSVNGITRAQQLPVSGGQGQIISTGSNQPFSLSILD